jgi:ornithine cyclodeaminase/alanine dehydrogenase-like protein (mu-crystallin family)
VNFVNQGNLIDGVHIAACGGASTAPAMKETDSDNKAISRSMFIDDLLGIG